MFVLREVENNFFPSNTLIYGISHDGSKRFNLRTWEHMILSQLRIGARSTTYAALKQILRANNFEISIYSNIQPTKRGRGILANSNYF